MTETYIFAQVQDPSTDVCKFTVDFSVATSDVLTLDPDFHYTVSLKKAFLPTSFYNLIGCYFTIRNIEGEKIFNLPVNVEIKSITALITQVKKALTDAMILEFLEVDTNPITLTKGVQGTVTLNFRAIQDVPYTLILSKNLASKLGFSKSDFHCVESFSVKNDFAANPFECNEKIFVTCSLCKPSRFNNQYLPLLQVVQTHYTSDTGHRFHEYDILNTFQIALVDNFCFTNFQITLIDETGVVMRCNPGIAKYMFFVICIKKHHSLLY